MNLLSELNGSVRMTEDLNSLDTRKVIEEPRTASEHRKSVPLNL